MFCEPLEPRSVDPSQSGVAEGPKRPQGSVVVGGTEEEEELKPDERPASPLPPFAPSSARDRVYSPYWISVIPSPARDPFFAACVVCNRYVRRKPVGY
jgi:hypothetical protein